MPQNLDAPETRSHTLSHVSLGTAPQTAVTRAWAQSMVERSPRPAIATRKHQVLVGKPSRAITYRNSLRERGRLPSGLKAHPMQQVVETRVIVQFVEAGEVLDEG